MRTSAIRRIAISVGPLLLTCVMHSHLTAAQTGQHTRQSTSPDQVARQFYDWYLRARFPTPKRSNMATFRKYVTRKLLKEATAPDVDAVVFIDAQDADSSWANNFTVSEATIHGQQATVGVLLKGRQFNWKLRVTLRRENGAWKIDDVKGGE